MEAFITNSNAKSIVYNLDVNTIDVEGEIFRIEFKWFSIYEVKGLLAFKLLFEDPEKFFQQYKKRKAIDTKQYIFEGKLPSYHLKPNCERLLSRFHNYKIPDEIKAQGDGKIAEFRLWFAENMDSLEKDPAFFLERMRMRFNLSVRPEVVDYENSGVETVENLNLEELDKRISELIENANHFYISDLKNTTILNHFGKFAFIYRTRKSPNPNNSGYSDEEIWKVLQKFDNTYKTPIITLLREYYRIKYNPEIKFEGKLLEQLGFQPCNQCENDYYRELQQMPFAEKLKRDLENIIKQYK